MTKNTDAFGGFDALVDMITKIDKDPNVKEEETLKLSKGVEDEEEEEEVAVEKEDEIEDEPVIPATKSTKKTAPAIEEEEEEEEEESTEEPTSIEDSDFSVVEPEISSYFANSLSEKFGLTPDEKAKFESLDDVVDFVGNIIKENSKPEFANDEVEEYDKFIRNGGKSLKDFYDQVYKDVVDPDKVDLESEKDQKAVIEANLKLLGYKPERIKKVIERYEDAEVLKDEAEDALESLKENQSKAAKTLLAEQEKQKLEAEKQNKQFFDNVIGYVNNLKDIRGVEVDSKTKKEIVDYIFRVQPDGSTQFQKAYASDVVKNLIESAYFTKYGDVLLNKTSKKATDAALNKVRDKLKASKGKRNTGSGSSLGKASPNFSTLSSLIIK